MVLVKTKTGEFLYSISQLAKEFGTTSRTIRFYEEKGLLIAQRSKGGRRIFNRKQRTRLRLILRGRRFGLSLEDIGHIIGPAEPGYDNQEQAIRALVLAEEKLPQIRKRIQELTALANDLDKLVLRLKECVP